MKPLPSLKYPAADLLLLLTKTVLFQLKGTSVVGKKSHGYRSSMPAKIGLKELCQHASCKHMNIMVSVDGIFCSHLGTVFRAVPDCMRQTGWGQPLLINAVIVLNL